MPFALHSSWRLPRSTVFSVAWHFACVQPLLVWRSRLLFASAALPALRSNCGQCHSLLCTFQSTRALVLTYLDAVSPRGVGISVAWCMAALLRPIVARWHAFLNQPLAFDTPRYPSMLRVPFWLDNSSGGFRLALELASCNRSFTLSVFCYHAFDDRCGTPPQLALSLCRSTWRGALRVRRPSELPLRMHRACLKSHRGRIARLELRRAR